MDFIIDPKDFKWAVRIVLLIALLVVCSKAAPLIWPERQGAVPQPMYYAPDPTPFVVDRGWEINIGSKNCLGWTVSCNNN